MKIFIGFVLMISCTVVANLLMKLGAESAAADRILFGMVSWKTLAGLAAFGSAAVIYAWLLQLLPLNVAQSFAAGQFVAVILASSLLLSEPIPLGRWVGIILIAAGIFLIGATGEFGQSSVSRTAQTQQ